MAILHLVVAAGLLAPSVLAAATTTSTTPTQDSATLGATTTAPASAPSDTSGLYSIESLPAFKSLTASCLQNCLLPIGLDEPTNCDDQTNDCACLSAPVEAQQAITDCLSTVCSGVSGSQLAGYASTATSLYLSYCSARYPAAALASATAADLSAIASASSAAAMSSEMTSSMSTTSMSTSTASSSASAATKSNGAVAARRGEGILGRALFGGAIVAIAAL